MPWVNYDFLKENGITVDRVVDKEHPYRQPEVPDGFRLFDVYDGDGRFGPMCVDVTDPQDWWHSATEGYEKWGLKLDTLLISTDVLVSAHPGYPLPRTPSDEAPVEHKDQQQRLLTVVCWTMMLAGMGLIALGGRGDAVWGWTTAKCLLTSFVGFALIYIGAGLRFGV